MPAHSPISSRSLMFWPSEKHSEFGEKGASQSKIYWNSWDMAFSYHYQGRIDFNTVNIHCNVGMYSLAIGMILNDMIQISTDGETSRLVWGLGPFNSKL